MTLHILSQQNTVLNKFIAEIRDKRIQRDSMRFRRNMERIGEITAYSRAKSVRYPPGGGAPPRRPAPGAGARRGAGGAGGGGPAGGRVVSHDLLLG